jgi:hypothetical protein
MTQSLLKSSLGFGFLLWFIGYLLGIVLFFVVPPTLVGWVIMPIGVAMTLWVLTQKIKSPNLQGYLVLSLTWTLIAITFDYFFLVKVFHPADGYYKLDVYLYYLFTFTLPLLISWRKKTT